MKVTKKTLVFAAILLLIVAGIIIYLLLPKPWGIPVDRADIPPPVIVKITGSNAPLQIFPGVAGIYLILPDGSLWRWGPTRTPVQIGTNRDWKLAFAANNHSVGLRQNGSLWNIFWGDSEKADPRTNWVDVAAGDVHSVALMNDGSLWAWGDNTQCQLGNGPGPNSPTLVQVGTNRDWAAVRAGGSYTLGLRKDGTLWLWGRVDWLGTTHASASFTFPTQLSNNTNWTGLTYQGALLRRHTTELWNPFNLPADGQSNPSTIGLSIIASNWIPNRTAFGAVATPSDFEIRADGTLWKAEFQFKSPKVQAPYKWRRVGKRSDWVSLWGFGTVVGLTSDGTVWMWGTDVGQKPIPDARSRFTLWMAQVMTWLKRPPATTMTQASLPYQEEPRPLMKIETLPPEGAQK